MRIHCKRRLGWRLPGNGGELVAWLEPDGHGGWLARAGSAKGDAIEPLPRRFRAAEAGLALGKMRVWIERRFPGAERSARHT